MQMPIVLDCAVTECAYNRLHSCHAMAITVGDGTSPCCDTFTDGSEKAGVEDVGGVGACKIAGCAHNRSFECQAESISVGRLTCTAECMTFEPL